MQYSKKQRKNALLQSAKKGIELFLRTPTGEDMFRQPRVKIVESTLQLECVVDGNLTFYELKASNPWS